MLRAYETFAAEWSPRKMARLFNAEKVRPPRGTSWTASAIYGSPRLGTGILRNPLYRGQVVWNRFAWQRNPETGARVPRFRDPSEWIVQQDESLRIVPEDLWDRVARRLHGAAETSARRSHPGGSPHRYPLSGLLVCGSCGAHYVMRGGSSYACSFHVNRGPAVCANALSVSRRLLEDRILRAMLEDIFTPGMVEYVARQVSDGIRGWAEGQRRALGDRHQLEDDLRTALAERDNIREAIRRGLSGHLTREMLEDVEARVRTAQARLDAPAIPVPSLRMLPQAIRAHLDHLDRVLRVDVDEARAVLRLVFDEIVLRPTPAGLVAHLHGNIEGLVSMTGDQALHVGTGSSGGWICPLTNTGGVAGLTHSHRPIQVVPGARNR